VAEVDTAGSSRALGRNPRGSAVSGREVVRGGGVSAVGFIDGADKSSVTGVDGGPGDGAVRGTEDRMNITREVDRRKRTYRESTS
jgi:hypothetical protein